MPTEHDKVRDKARDERDYQTFVKKGTPFEWRVVNKLELHYKFGDTATIYILQPLLSGFDLTDPASPKALAVLNSEFSDIFTPKED